MRSSREIRAEIEACFGFLPPFFVPTLSTPEVCETLWQQTRLAYVNNPLPALLKEKLFALLALHRGVRYALICQSCALHRLGMTGEEVFELLAQAAASACDPELDRALLAAQAGPLLDWPAPGSRLDRSLVGGATRLVTDPERAGGCRIELQRLLGDQRFLHLSIFLSYAGMCLTWIAAHPALSCDVDERVRTDLAPLVHEEPRLAELFRGTDTFVAKLAPRGDALAAAHEALAQANRELEGFGSAVVHGLRAPLRDLDGFAKLLMKRTQDGLEPVAARYVHIIASQAAATARLLDDLLICWRGGRAELRLQPIDLNALVAEVRAELGAEARGRDIAWYIDRLPVVEGDRSLLRLAWVNVLSNAITQTVTPGHARIEIGTAATQNDDALFFVRDNGFESGDASTLFTPIAHLERHDDFDGMGIGLATARRIIQRHGGRMWAEGRADHRATVYFTLKTTGPEGLGDPGASIR